LEEEIVTLRKDIQKKSMQNSLKFLDDIISSQKSHHDKFGIGYNQTEKGSISKTTKQETYPKRYAETIKGGRKIYKEDYRDTPPLRRFRFHNQQPKDRPQGRRRIYKSTSFQKIFNSQVSNYLFWFVLCM
jgi:hypothetical protein